MFPLGTCVAERLLAPPLVPYDPDVTSYVVLDGSNDDTLQLRNTRTRERSIGHTWQYVPTTPPEHNFKLKKQAWEVAIFKNAQSYTVHALIGRGKYESTDFDDFLDATACSARTPRSLVYARCFSGRFLALGPQEWPLWVPLWKSLPGVKPHSEAAA